MKRENTFNLISNDILCSIIIPVHNNIKFTQAAILSLLKLPSNYEIIIVDNDSTDSTQDTIMTLINNRSIEGAQLLYFHFPRNLGFGRANNWGYKHSNGKYVLFLNNDIRIEDRYTDWPLIMLEWAKQGYLVGTQGGVLDRSFNFVREGFELPQTKYWYMSGWCICSSRQNFDKLILNHYSDDKTDVICTGKAFGPWNEKFFAYFEDGDLSWRAKRKGIKFKEVHVPIHHFGRMTGKQIGLNYMYKRSRRVFKNIWKDNI